MGFLRKVGRALKGSTPRARKRKRMGKILEERLRPYGKGSPRPRRRR